MEISDLQITEDEKRQLNEWAPFLSFKQTLPFKWVINSPSKITAQFSGNQYGKTASASMSYVLRILGMHPIPERNINPDDPVRTFRFASETLPQDDESEVKNTQYPEFKKWLPASLIKKDITIRKPVMTIKCPRGGKDIMVEFVSFNQDTQAMAGVQRKSIWIDENSGQGFFEEQIPRLLAADGDLLMTYTPVPGSSGWEFDSLYERAGKIYRTPAVLKRIYERTGEKLPILETVEGGEDITVILAATDDNPLLTKETIDGLFSVFDDPDEVDARRYGMFRQLSGKIFKDFKPQIHVISRSKLFPDGVPHGWKHFRAVDYHQHVPWACVWASISPQDEMFVWNEMNPSPEKMVTHEIAREMVYRSGDYKYELNLIDPLANQKQPNTGMSTTDDLNRIFYEFKKEISECTGGYWSGWDTKSTRGRDEVRKRLKNALLVGAPFNNETVKDGRKLRLPTLWITDNCQEVISSMRNWRWEEWSSRDMLLTRDEKETPMQRWSHFCMAIECLLKDPRASMARFKSGPVYHEPKRYYAFN